MYAAFRNPLASNLGVDVYVRETTRENHRSPPDAGPQSGRRCCVLGADESPDARCACRATNPAARSFDGARAARGKGPDRRGRPVAPQKAQKTTQVGVLVASPAPCMRLAMDLAEDAQSRTRSTSARRQGRPSAGRRSVPISEDAGENAGFGILPQLLLVFPYGSDRPACHSSCHWHFETRQRPSDTELGVQKFVVLARAVFGGRG